MKLDSYLAIYQIKLKMKKGLNVRAKTLQYLEENRIFGFFKWFLDMTPKAQVIKEEAEILYFIKI